MTGLRCRAVEYLSLLVALLVADAGAQEAALSLGLATTALPVDEQALLDMMAGASGVLEAGPSAGPRNYLTDKDAAGSVPLTPVNHSAFESLGRRLAETCGQVAGGWGQCGGQSNCPAGAPCGDRDWYPSVCCPIVYNTAQNCQRVNQWYYQCLPVPTTTDSSSMPHVGPDPSTASPPPPVAASPSPPPPPSPPSPSPPAAKSPPPAAKSPPPAAATKKFPPPAAKSPPPPPPPKKSPPPPPVKRPPPPRRSPPPPPVRSPPPASPAPTPPATLAAGGKYAPGQVIWADEFSGFSGATSGIDPAKWNFQNGDGSYWGIKGWGNNELQVYQEANAQVVNGALIMTANYDGKEYTSSRMRTIGLADFTPNGATPNGIRVAANILLPEGGQGIWPAFWMLPSESPPTCSGCGVYGGWPTSGEIDIMEAVNSMNTAYGTLHYGGPVTTMSSGWSQGSYSGPPLSAGFHQYSVDWGFESISFAVDNVTYITTNCACKSFKDGSCGLSSSGYYSTNPSNDPSYNKCAPFDRNFHIILNIAIGGGWPGNPTSATSFPQQMVVDWVRVTAL